jgi:acetyl esterase/lipase
MKRSTLIWTALAGATVAGLGVAAYRRLPKLEPFVETAHERRLRRFYSRPEHQFARHLRDSRIVVDGQTLDAKFQHLLELGGEREAARRMFRLLFATSAGRHYLRLAGDRRWLVFSKESAPMRRTTDLRVQGRGGAVPVRIYWPQVDDDAPLPILVYAHGGGFIAGSIAAMDRVARLMANETRAIVVSVGYRLAPEHPFPAAADDMEDVFLWVRRHAGALGGDPARVAVGGDSAGGHAAINVAQRQVFAHRAPPAMLLLFYPAAGLPLADRSFRLFASGFGLDAAFIDYLFPRVWPTLVPGKDKLDALVDPRGAPSLAGLPPAVVATAGFDVLRDAGAGFARRLREAGVPVRYRNYGALVHGFLQFGGVVEAADEAATETLQAFGRALQLGYLPEDMDAAPAQHTPAAATRAAGSAEDSPGLAAMH